MSSRPCTVDGCTRVEQLRRGMCNLHRMRFKVYGDPLKVTKRPAGSGAVRADGYIMHESGGRSVLEHVAIAERAIGKRLPQGAQVHHVDGNRANNAASNLVVCPDAAYHQLLHVRAAAYAACGHYEWRKCHICKRYDDPANLRFYRASGLIRHIECWRRQYAEKKRAA